LSSLAPIESARARKVLDSRGRLTIEVEVETALGGIGRFSAPSGASVGAHEAAAFPRGGVEEALKLFREEVAPKLIGMDSSDQRGVDEALRELDGTPNFERLGGSMAIACSIAVAKAASHSFGLPLYRWLGGAMANRIPAPLGNVLGGGKHAAVRTLDIQEVLVFPLDASSALEAVMANAEVHRRLPSRIAKVDPSFAGGRTDEGAWTARLSGRQALALVKEVCEEVSDELGCRMGLGIDLAASSLWDDKAKVYRYEGEGAVRSMEEQLSFVESLLEEFNLLYVEDPFHEEDFESFAQLTRRVAPRMVCGDDLFTTNVERLRRGVESGAANAVIIKPNQVGTLTDTFEAAALARSKGYTLVASHRSGETEDEALPHIAIALSAQLIKTGVVGGERTAKLNELVRIEEEAPSSRVATFTFQPP
jgi:enolase